MGVVFFPFSPHFLSCFEGGFSVPPFKQAASSLVELGCKGGWKCSSPGPGGCLEATATTEAGWLASFSNERGGMGVGGWGGVGRGSEWTLKRALIGKQEGYDSIKSLVMAGASGETDNAL